MKEILLTKTESKLLKDGLTSKKIKLVPMSPENMKNIGMFEGEINLYKNPKNEIIIQCLNDNIPTFIVKNYKTLIELETTKEKVEATKDCIDFFIFGLGDIRTLLKHFIITTHSPNFSNDGNYYDIYKFL